MADTPQFTPPQSTLPSFPVAHVAVGITYGEMMITLGQSKVGMGVDDKGVAVPMQGQDWFQTIAISPQTMLVLQHAISEALAIYQKQFGALPKLPETVMKVNMQPQKLPG